MTICAMVAADVVGVSMTVTMHARVVVHVDAPYSARRPYMLGESETSFTIHKEGTYTINTELTSPEATSADDKNWKLKQATVAQTKV